MKITYDNKTRAFSIQGETGLQLRKLKEFAKSISTFKEDIPKLPTFYSDLDIEKKSRLEYKLKNELNLKDAKILDYLNALSKTYNYDVDNNTKLLDAGWLIIMSSDKPIDGYNVGMLINFKDRSGTKIWTYKVKDGEKLNPKEFTESSTKKFSKSRKEVIENIISRAKWDRVDKTELPYKLRDKIRFSSILDNGANDYDFLIDEVKDNSNPISESDDYQVYKLTNDTLIMIPEDLELNPQLKLLKDKL